MRNHANWNFVYIWEQLAELSEAQVMLGIRPQIKTSCRRDI